MNVPMLLLLLSSDPTVLSAELPPTGESSFAIGVAVYSALPMLSVRYLHGLSESVAADLAIDTAGVAQVARAGVRFACVSGRVASLSVRWSALEAHTALDEPIVLFGMGPGVILSFPGAGGSTWSFALDGAMMAAPNRGPLIELRPSVGFELPLGPSLGFVAEVGAMILGDTDPLVLPVVTTALRF
jgi:hypothetical protein